ncbi:hypothetical protein F5Y08DRAFT_353322 [Xylaria arbuscula]|uniref:Mid2 domain-containing protein n=1 Tax=Xylaria arbuscula TaxID=114810 RepID=A0A9W8NKX0_9PEZI|nr:hypothetical protein F5Y08DRAFT_353322 [Xylaria arbuscula]KAJ3578382.1 hypothetical protein NPX13_g2185 [Xylaria arbuscula]
MGIMGFILVLWLATLFRVMAASHFVSPRSYPPNGHGKYGANARWQLGSSQLVGFQTNWTAYSVQLWQQLPGVSAKKATDLVYNQIEGEDMPQSFYWTVQTYDLLLSDSPVFFFSLQDRNSPVRQPSPFFNISIGNTPVHSTITGGSTTLTTSSTSIETALPASSSSQNVVMNQGISAGVAAGIGIGVASGVLLLAVTVWLIFWRRNRDEQQPVEIDGNELVLTRRNSVEKKRVIDIDQPRLELPG